MYLLHLLIGSKLLGIRAAFLIHQNIPFDIVVAANVQSNRSLLLQDLRMKHLQFIENVNATRNEDNKINVVVETLTSLMSRYKVLLDTHEDLEILNELANYCSGTTIGTWLKKELLKEKANKKSKLSNILSSYQLQHIFKMFIQKYWQKNDSSFVLERLASKMDKARHTLLLLDEFQVMSSNIDWNPEVYEHLDLFLAVDPMSCKNIKKTEFLNYNKNVLSAFLPTKHRICHEIDLVVQNLIGEGVQTGALKTHLEDCHKILPQGEKPVWICIKELNSID